VLKQTNSLTMQMPVKKELWFSSCYYLELSISSYKFLNMTDKIIAIPPMR
jgi:hypothetical protein